MTRFHVSIRKKNESVLNAFHRDLISLKLFVDTVVIR
jgi:hypothetical protein